MPVGGEGPPPGAGGSSDPQAERRATKRTGATPRSAATVPPGAAGQARLVPGRRRYVLRDAEVVHVAIEVRQAVALQVLVSGGIRDHRFVDARVIEHAAESDVDRT